MAGCSHLSTPETPRELAPVADPMAPPPAAAPGETARRWSEPGTPFTRGRPDLPFVTRLAITTYAAHEDIFPFALPPRADRPRLGAITRLFRGQHAFILPLTENHAVNARGRADLTYEIKVHRPDGSPDGTTLSLPFWQERVIALELPLHPAVAVRFHAEPKDPVGLYTFTVIIHDHLGRESRELTHQVLVEEYSPPDLHADFEPEKWLNNYYLDPTPELALPALARFFQKLPSDRRNGALPPLLGFYDQVLLDNPWLLPAFARRLAAADPDEALALSLVLGFHLRGSETPPAGIDGPTWERLADFRTHDWPADPDSPLVNASQLDALWGRFFASAAYAPVRRLLEPLAHTADLGAAERWRQNPPAPLDEASPADLDDPSTPASVRREILLRTALWSLRANARQHPLVRDYLDQAIRRGDLSPPTRLLLQRALLAEPPFHPSVPRS